MVHLISRHIWTHVSLLHYLRGRTDADVSGFMKEDWCGWFMC